MRETFLSRSFAVSKNSYGVGFLIYLSSLVRTWQLVILRLKTNVIPPVAVPRAEINSGEKTSLLDSLECEFHLMVKIRLCPLLHITHDLTDIGFRQHIEVAVQQAAAVEHHLRVIVEAVGALVSQLQVHSVVGNGFDKRFAGRAVEINYTDFTYCHRPG